MVFSFKCFYDPPSQRKTSTTTTCLRGSAVSHNFNHLPNIVLVPLVLLTQLWQAKAWIPQNL